MAKLLVVLCALLLLSSCSYIPSGSGEDLLVAPRLSTRQQEVYDALEATLNISQIRYRYPQSGEFRSPFVFYDLDGDGVEEAIVFYSDSTDPSDTARVRILRQGQTGWMTANDLSGAGKEVGFLEFVPLLEPDAPCMLIGWSSGSDLLLGVYSSDDQGLREEILEPCAGYTRVQSEDGLGRILLVTPPASGYRATLSLYGRGVGGHLQELDRFGLADGVTEIVQILPGRLWQGDTGIYIDEKIRREGEGVLYATEILRIEDDHLEAVATQEEAEDFSVTERFLRTLSFDRVGSGRIDTPIVYQELPGQEEEMEPVYLYQYMRIEESGFWPSAYGVFNDTDGYRVFFPDAWADRVTVQRQSENREWRFYIWDEQEDRLGAELLRIRVYFSGDYMDQFTRDDYLLLGENGQRQYYAYLPKQDDPSLAVTQEQVGEMVQLVYS